MYIPSYIFFCLSCVLCNYIRCLVSSTNISSVLNTITSSTSIIITITTAATTSSITTLHSWHSR